jgi:hypothetical protein
MLDQESGSYLLSDNGKMQDKTVHAFHVEFMQSVAAY